MKTTLSPTPETPARGALTLQVFPPEAQGTGAFDGGKITEIKPVPFPHERGGSRRVGSLLYWAWASARGDGVIGMHPHRGFEIVSYVLDGAIGHTDTAGNNRRVSAGGAQMMQTGSGVSHQEEMYGERTEFFQIWFEPNLTESLARPPVYADFEDGDFERLAAGEGVTVKPVIGGEHGRIQLAAPSRMDEIGLAAGATYALALPENHAAGIMVIEGAVDLSAAGEHHKLPHRHFALAETAAAAELHLASDAGARVVIVEVPRSVTYPLSS